MKILRKGLIGVGIVIIAVGLILLDYTDLSWSENKTNYGLILVGLLGITSMIYSIQHDQKTG